MLRSCEQSIWPGCWSADICLCVGAAEYDQLDTGAAAEAFGIPDLRRQLLSKASGECCCLLHGLFDTVDSL